MVNRLFKNIVWTQRANFVDVPTDCPQRDERMGWCGDAQAYIRSATYNADTAAFYTKWFRELMESQHPTGPFPSYAPFPFSTGPDFGTAWGDAGVICPWTIYRVYGDTRIIDRCWEPMVKFLDWRKKTRRRLPRHSTGQRLWRLARTGEDQDAVGLHRHCLLCHRCSADGRHGPRHRPQRSGRRI